MTQNEALKEALKEAFRTEPEQRLAEAEGEHETAVAAIKLIQSHLADIRQIIAAAGMIRHDDPARHQDWRNAVRALNQAKANLMDAARHLT